MGKPGNRLWCIVFFTIWCFRLFLNKRLWVSCSHLYTKSGYHFQPSFELTFQTLRNLMMHSLRQLIFYICCVRILLTIFRKVYNVMSIFSLGRTYFIEFLKVNFPLYITSVKAYRQLIVNTEEGIFPFSMVSKLSLFNCYPVFARRASLAGEN